MMSSAARLHQNVLCLAVCSCLAGGCTSQAERELAAGVVTALPGEVMEHCAFIDNVDTSGRSSIGAARFSLQLQTARLGGNLLVETHAYAVPRPYHASGVALSGRAYRCPPGHQLRHDSRSGRAAVASGGEDMDELHRSQGPH